MNEKLETSNPLTRTERQKEILKKWINNRCKGTAVCCTGFGKTNTALMGCDILNKKFPGLRIIVVVPTETLQRQWIKKLDERGFSLQSDVIIINTLIKNNYDCDLLILDEVHRYCSELNSQVFDRVKYKYILGLSATMERLDGKHEILYKYCPEIDRVTELEALANGWLAQSTEYKIILDVDDIDVYKKITKEFNEHFEFFQFKFDLVMGMLGKDGYKNRSAYRDTLCQLNPKLDKKEVFKSITYHATAFSRCMQARKKFINNHPKKIELTREIIKARPFSKIITFSASIDIAEQIGIGDVYSGKTSKKNSRVTLDKFITGETRVLSTIKRCNEGLDVPGINVAIMLGYDSSPTQYIQRKGRAIRYEGSKVSEIFTFVINNTVEMNWFDKSHADSTSIPIDEENLMKVLRGEEYQLYKKPQSKFTFRF